MQNYWTKFFAQTLLAVTLIVLAAIALRAIYVRVGPPPSTEVRQNGEINREVANCEAHRRPSVHPARQSEDEAIWKASCLES